MYKFFKKYNISKLNQGEIENINRLITGMEIKIVIKIFPTNRSPKPYDVMGEFYQKLKRRANNYSAQTLPEIYRGRKTPKCIL